ncbi:PfkB family carbohydrate kinase [Schumannella sp. 10F1B-5-1]|uniref:PfkB family carbohydrate kinase n=1 Tax=Schumannella sp. 10F1B-5-1 TaxID=2590780 RepID=UPI0011315B4F|nr:PfkB family carbohydrate kinase [Schumannella sp. 10F1B-5-1]TPW76876.1 ribokinase [Schumannella sp. 10F1B-5-1]
MSDGATASTDPTDALGAAGAAGAEPVDVLVVGSVNLDLGFELDRLPRSGETIESRSARRTGGGKGANQALAAVQLGARTVLLAAVGPDAEPALADLVAGGVRLDALVRMADVPTGSAVLLVTPDDNAIVIAPGANARLSAEHVRALAEALGAGTGSGPAVVALQHEVPAEVVAAAVAAFGGRSRILLNPSPWRPVAPEVLAGVDVLVVNAGELGELLGVAHPEAPAPGAAGSGAGERAAAERLLATASPELGTLVVTLGSDGVLLREGAGGPVVHLPAIAVDARDTVGAGDAFLGALAAGLASGASLEAAARRATAAAALAVTVPGARNPGLTPSAVDELLAR